MYCMNSEIRLPNRRYKCIGPHEPFNSTTLILESASEH